MTTDADGYYRVTGISPGTYRIVEIAQPAGYLDGQDTAGTVDGFAQGQVGNDEIGEIFLGGGGVGREYNFGELVPITLRGNVHLSTADGDCFSDDVAHEPVAGAKVLLLDATGTVIDETVTDDQGDYAFEQLRPGVYGLVEITPAGLLDGHARAGELVDARRSGLVKSVRTDRSAASGWGREMSPRASTFADDLAAVSAYGANSGRGKRVPHTCSKRRRACFALPLSRPLPPRRIFLVTRWR